MSSKNILLVCAMLFPLEAQAHDYWLAPEAHHLDAPRAIGISLFVGDAFTPETERVVEKSRYPRAAVLRGTATQTLIDPKRADGAKPILKFTPDGIGGHLVVVDRNASTIEMDAEKFAKYLKRKGLDHVLEQRAKLGEADAVGRERYSRCLKSLVQVGDTKDDAYGARSGQTLELIPQSNPSFLGPGKTLKVIAEFQGKALANAQLEAVSNTDGKLAVQTYRTNRSGEVTVKIDHHGIWMLRLVHMVRCDGCANVDWESFWTTYTFETKR